MSEEIAEDPKAVAGFTVFRFAEGRPHIPSGPPKGLTEVSMNGLQRMMETKMGGGAESRVLFETPGFSVMYAWFKSGFPLHRHSHGPDCLYEIIGGSLQMGEEVLRKGDGFFVPSGAPYAFVPGPDGVEVLEFRHEPIRDTVIHANNPAFWERAVEAVTTNAERWKTEPRPAA
jgi:hypothetical protein